MVDDKGKERTVELVKETAKGYGLAALLKSGRLAIVGDGMTRATMKELTSGGIFHICTAHSFQNLLKRVFEDNLKHFLPSGKKMYDDINQLVLKADTDYKKLDETTISINKYLTQCDVHDEDREMMAATRLKSPGDEKAKQKLKYLPIKVKVVAII